VSLQDVWFVETTYKGADNLHVDIWISFPAPS